MDVIRHSCRLTTKIQQISDHHRESEPESENCPVIQLGEINSSISRDDRGPWRTMTTDTRRDRFNDPSV